MASYANKTKAELISEISKLKRKLNKVEKFKEEKRSLISNTSALIKFYKNSPLLYQSLDKQGRLIEVNSTWLKKLGYRKKDVIGKRFTQFLIPSCQKQFRNNFKIFISGGEIYGVDYTVLTKSGKELIVEFNGMPEKDEKNNFLKSHCFMYDLTKRISSEKALGESERKFSDLTEKSVTGVYLIQDGIFKYINPKLAEIFGYKVSELINKRGPKYVTHPDDWSTVKSNLSKRISGKVKNVHYTFRGIRKDKRVINVEVYGSRTVYNGKPAVIGSLIDITEQFGADKIIRESEKRYKYLFENSPVALWEEDFSPLLVYFDELKQSGVNNFRKFFDNNPGELKKCDKKVKVVDVNKACLRLHKARAKKDLLGNLYKTFTPESYIAFKEELIAVAEGKSHINVEGKIKTLKGDIRDVLIDVYLHRKGHSYEIGKNALIAITDITSMKRIEDELRLQLKTNEQILETTFDGFILGDPNGNIVDVNKAYCDMIGYKKEELLKMNIRAIEVVIPKKEIDRRIKQMISAKKDRFETKHKRKDGTLIDLDVSVSIFDIEGVPHIAAFVRDITEKLKSEKLIKSSEANISSLIEARDEAIWSIDNNYNFIVMNNFFRETYLNAYNLEIKKGMNAIDILSPGLKSIWKPKYDLALKGERIHFEFSEKIDGVKRYFDIYLNPIVADGKVTGVSAISIDNTKRHHEQEELKRARERLQYLVSNNPAVIYTSDVTENYPAKFISENIKKLVGFEPDDFIKNPGFWSSRIHPDDKERVRTELTKLFEKDHHLHEYRFMNKNGEYRWMQDELNIIRDSDGNPEELIGYWVDITERKKAEETLRDHNQLLSIILESTADGILVGLNDGTFTFANKRFIDMWQIPPDLMRSKNRNRLIDYVSKQLKDPEGFIKRLDVVYNSDKKEFDVIEFKDGRVYERYSEPMIKQGKPIGRVLSFRDITEQLAREKAIKTSEANLSSLIEGREEAIWSIDRNYNIVVINNFLKVSFLNNYNIDLEPGMNAVDVLPERMRNIWKEKYDEALTGKKVEFEYSETLNNHTSYVDVFMNPIVTDNTIVGVSTIAIDVTNRVQTEKALIESEQKISAVFNSAADGITVTDLDGDIVQVNRTTIKIYGAVDEKDFLGKNAGDFFIPSQRKKVFDYFKNVLFNNYSETTEFRALKVDGTPFPVEINASVLKDNVGKPIGFVGLIKDISERKKVEEALRASEERYRTLVEQASDGIFVADPEGNYVEVNSSGCEMIGYTHDELVQKNLSDLIEPGNLEKEPLRLEELKAGKTVLSERNLIRKDGSILPVEINAKLLPDGRLQGIARDITERKKTQKLLSIRARQHEVLAALGQLALTTSSLTVLFEKTVKKVAEALDVKYCKILTMVPGRDGLLLKAGWGWKEGLVGKAFVGSEKDSQAGFTILSNKPVVVTDLKEEKRFHGPQLLHDHNVVSGISTIIGEVQNPYGVLGAHSTKKREFTKDDVNFLQSIANMLAEAIKRKNAEEKIIESEQNYRGIFNNATDSIYVQDKEGKFLDVNLGAIKMYGYAKQEFIGRTPEFLSAPGKNDFKKLKIQTQKAFEGEPQQFEFWGRRKNGEIFPKIVRLQKGSYFGKDVVIAFALDITESKKYEEKLKESRNRLRSLADKLQMIREEERATVAREIHDDLGQALTALKMDISWLKRNSETDKKMLAQKYEMMLELVNSSIQTVKRIATQLRPGILDDLGLVPAIEWQLSEFKKRTNVECNLSINKKDFQLEDEISIAVFRVFQETLTNIARHARCTKVDINIDFSDDALKMKISDNGIGMNRKKIESPKSLGIFGMRERISILKGDMDIKSFEGKGTTIEFSIPVNLKNRFETGE